LSWLKNNLDTFRSLPDQKKREIIHPLMLEKITDVLGSEEYEIIP
jgi:hypothetical protein